MSLGFDGISTVMITWNHDSRCAGIAKFKIDPLQMPKGMGALGLGTLAFLGVFAAADALLKPLYAGIGGIEGGDKLMEKMGSMDAIMKSAIGSFVGAFEGVSVSHAIFGIFGGGRKETECWTC